MWSSGERRSGGFGWIGYLDASARTWEPSGCYPLSLINDDVPTALHSQQPAAAHRARSFPESPETRPRKPKPGHHIRTTLSYLPPPVFLPRLSIVFPSHPASRLLYTRRVERGKTEQRGNAGHEVNSILCNKGGSVWFSSSMKFDRN